MSVSIHGCPACSAMLIGDSPSCPHCGHVLDAARASSEFLDLIPSGELALSDGDDEQPCKQCGEMVRVGLVRCWHCGAFTNPDIEATYQRMQASPTPIMYSDVSNVETEQTPEHAPMFSSAADDDGGFELDDSYGLKTTMDDGYAVATPPRNPAPAPAADSDYQLAVAQDDDFSVETADNTAYQETIPHAEVSQQQTYDQAAYDQALADQAAYDQQYQTPWGYKLSADGTAYEIDYEAWQAAGYDPNAAPGEPGYYDPYAGQSAEQQDYPAEGYPVAEAAADVQPAAEAAAAPPAAAVRPSAGAELPAPPEVAHSVSTGGEALLAAAIEEEKDYAKIRKAGGRRRANADAPPPGSFVIYCPNGHRVQVHERHRGRAGRCPSCKAVFFVPLLVTAPEGTTPDQAVPTGPQKFEAGDYTDWMFELRLHTVNPQKLKLKPGAMAAEYDVADIAFSNQDLLVAMVFKRAGTFAAMQEKKKKPATRIAVADFLQTKKPTSGLPVPFQTLVTANDASQLKIVQPSIPGEESIFAGIPVFGPGRIVVRLPVVLDGGSRVYLSFSLSEFREFARLVEKVFGIANFGQELGIPLTDSISTYKCHYSENELPTLDNADFYLPDPALKPIVLGHKCAGCGLIVSEDARKKEKIGGKTEASIAKATCPKCKKKFGSIPLYGLDPNAKPVEFGMLPAEK